MTNNKGIFVTGATGNQGGAVARKLANLGFRVKALTRNTESARALELKKLNVQLVKGDLNNTDTFREDLKDAYGVFSVQTFVNGIDKEILQGTSLATLSKELGVQHLLYSSVSGVDSNTGVAHIDSKFKIESHIRQLGMPFTIIRPSSLYQNFLLPQVKKGILKGKLMQPINRNTTLQYIAAEDIGNVASKIFQNSDMYLGKTIPLSTEQLNGQQVADLFSKALNKKVEYKKLPSLLTRVFLGKSLYKMFKMMDERVIFPEDSLDATRAEFPGLLSLESWIKMNFIS